MIPVKLTLINFISHIHSVLDFTKFDSALVVGSYEGDPNIANGVGKSSLMDAIRFALFGKTKFNVKTKMVKRGKEFCQVEFIFLINDDFYKVVRKLSVRTGIITVDFCKKEKNEWIYKGWTCDTPTQTNNKIIDVIGMNDDTFVNISYFRQNDVSGFASANTTKRKEILKEGLRIGIWDEYQKVSKDSEKSLNQQLFMLEERIRLLGNVEQEISKIDTKILEKKTLLENHKESLIVIEDSLKECNDNITDMEILIAKNGLINNKELEKSLSDITNRSKEIKNRKAVLVEIVNKNEETISNTNNNCENLNKKILEHYRYILITNYRNRAEALGGFNKLTKDEVPEILYSSSSLEHNCDVYGTHKNKLDELNFDLKRLVALEPGDECPTCLSTIDNPKSILKKRAAKKSLLEEKILEQKKLLEGVDKLIKIEKSALDKAEISAIEVERINLTIAKYRTIISELSNENKRANEEFKNLVDEWQKLKIKKQEILGLLENTNKSNLNETLSDLFRLRRELDIQLNAKKEEVMRLNLECGNLEGCKEGLLKKLSEKQTLTNERDELVSNISVYSKLSSAFGKDGIQAIIMENITEDLRQYTNAILRNIYYKPINIDFITQKQTSAGTWREDFEILISIDNEVYDFEDVSGGEQVRISIALRLALSHLLMRRIGSNIKFLLFDEVDQSLDKHGLEALFETINELSKEFKILVISHSDFMKERFEHVINVHMNSNGSVLR